MQAPTGGLVHRRLVIALLLVLANQLGCQPAGEPQADRRSQRKSPALPTPANDEQPAADQLPTPTVIEAGVKPWITTEQLPWEAWYLQYLNGKRIGYAHVSINKSSLENNDKLIRINRIDSIEMADGGSTSLFTRTIESQEYTDGRLISVSDTSQSVDNVAKTEGKLANNTFAATTTLDGEVTTTTLAWQPGAWGLLGLQAILMQRPPKPGELLKAKVFIPQLYKIADTELLAGQPELTTLPGEKTQSLLPVEVLLWTDDGGMRSRNWINSRGEVLKTISLSGPNLITFRTEPEVAHRVRDEFELQGHLPRRVPLAGGEGVVGAETAVYAVQRSADSPGAEVYSLLAKTPQQTVTSLNALSAEATVRSMKPEQLQSEDSRDPSSQHAELEDSYLAASPLVPADHPAIDDFATQLSKDAGQAEGAEADGADQLSVALQLTASVHEKIALSPLDREVTTALQTVHRLQGDCVEQAILLMTLLRSQKIPARVASGLVADPENSPQMRFGMWTEAWVSGQWVSLDATTGQLTKADRLKILDSDLSGENPYPAILPVFRELGGLEIKVLSHE